MTRAEAVEESKGPKQTQSEAVFFQTHLLHPEILQRFRKLRNEIPDWADLFFLFDVDNRSPSKRRLARQVAGDALIRFTFDQVVRACRDYPHPWAEDAPTGVVPGNNDLLWIYIRSQFEDYSRYWFIEHDVAFTGDWSTILDYYHDHQADLLGTTLHPRNTLPEFHWWKRFSSTGEPANSSLLRGFFPIVRLTYEALTALHEVYRAGWSGHAEVVVPTAMYRQGLEITDLGKDGPFARDDGRGFYTNTPTRTTLAPGTFVYKPSRRFPGLRRNMLWHPVKPTAGRISPYIQMMQERFRALRQRHTN